MDVDDNARVGFEGSSLKLQFYDLGVEHRAGRCFSNVSASSLRKCALFCCAPETTACLRRRQHPDAGGGESTPTRSTSASSPLTRTPSRMPASFLGHKIICFPPSAASCAGGARSLALGGRPTSSFRLRSCPTVSLPELPQGGWGGGKLGRCCMAIRRSPASPQASRWRRDHADFCEYLSCTRYEGVKGKRAVDWRLV